MKKWISALLISLLVHPAFAQSDVFSFHLFSEPHNLDPQLTSSASGNYLFFNVYRGLYRFHDEKGLIADGAKDCRRQGSNLVCQLQPDGKWSNGAAITAADYVAAFRRLIDPALASPQADVLFSLKNARAIWRKEKPIEQLGVSAEGPLTLKIELEEEDPEFEFKLIHPALSPLPPGGYLGKNRVTDQVTSGPYQIKEWRNGGWIQLQNNPHYHVRRNRPEARVFFVDHDSTAITLFESGKMTFLRRITAAEIPRLRTKPGFRQFPMARFDYIGFGPQLNDSPEVREALVKSVDFPQFKRLFDTFTPPGCPSLPANLMDRVPCLKFEPKVAKARLKKNSTPPKEFKFSKMGGDDIARGAEWFQGQWKKNLKWKIEIGSEEQTVYLHRLRTNPPPIFRKGVNLDRPTCLAGLEIFTKDHPENYIQLNDREYEKRVKEVASAKSDSERKVACRKAVEYLMTTHRLIPLGEMFFSTLASPKFTGWTLNSLNQLDLTDLKAL